MAFSVATPAILCQGIVKHFGAGRNAVRVLRGVDLAVSHGALTMLVGPSGSGKTTLLSIIAGILSPTAGDVMIDSTSIVRMPDRERVAFRRRTIGFVLQQYNLLPALTAAENAAVPLVAAGRTMRDSVAAALPLLAHLGLAAHAHKLPSQLSVGEQQRVAIARALVHDPRLVLCDEPTAALDAENGSAAMAMIRAVAVKPGRAVIVVTHDNRAARFADRLVRIEDGLVIAEEGATRRGAGEAM